MPGTRETAPRCPRQPALHPGPSSSKHQASSSSSSTTTPSPAAATPAQHQAARATGHCCLHIWTLSAAGPPNRNRSVKVACLQPQIYRRERGHRTASPAPPSAFAPKEPSIDCSLPTPVPPAHGLAGHCLPALPALLAVLCFPQWNPHRTTGPPAIPALAFLAFQSFCPDHPAGHLGTIPPPRKGPLEPPRLSTLGASSHSHRAVCKSPALPKTQSPAQPINTVLPRSPAAHQHSVPASPTPLFWPCWIFARPARANGGWPLLSHHYSTQTQLDLSRSRSISS